MSIVEEAKNETADEKQLRKSTEYWDVAYFIRDGLQAFDLFDEDTIMQKLEKRRKHSSIKGVEEEYRKCCRLALKDLCRLGFITEYTSGMKNIIYRMYSREERKAIKEEREKSSNIDNLVK